MKIYERPMLNISKFDTDIATTSSGSDPTEPNAYSKAQDAALAAVNNNENNVFRVRLAF